jgi:hypothetical protein
LTFEELVFNIAREMMLKSGVREWESPETVTAIANAARCMAVQLLGGEEAMATNAVYIKYGTPIRFGSEVTDTVAWTTEAVANAAGRQAAYHDQGDNAAARPLAWKYEIVTQWAATPTASTILDCRLKTKDDAGVSSNDDGEGDIAVSAVAKLNNLIGLNCPVCDEAAANIPTRSTGVIQIPQRYFCPVLWNLSGAATKNDGPATYAIFTPMFEEIQAST